ncbi:MAG: 30S ribosomal protein S2 [Flavobacteriales bacterium]
MGEQQTAPQTMEKIDFQELLEAGVHYGHLKRKWNPNIAPYIFDEKEGVHVIDLNKTSKKIEEATSVLKDMAKNGKKILFVATKKQAKDILEERIKPTNMPYVTERWPGGMLTNFATIRRAIRKMNNIDKRFSDGTYDNLSKRERLAFARERDKLKKHLGSVAGLTRLPAALFVVDINKENIAVDEARKLNIPTFGIVDTNSDPSLVDYPIPANDDASESIKKVLDLVIQPIEEALQDREQEKEQRKKEKAAAEKEEKEQEGSDSSSEEDKDEGEAAEKSTSVESKKAESKSGTSEE